MANIENDTPTLESKGSDLKINKETLKSLFKMYSSISKEERKFLRVEIPYLEKKVNEKSSKELREWRKNIIEARSGEINSMKAAFRKSSFIFLELVPQKEFKKLLLAYPKGFSETLNLVKREKKNYV